MSLRSVLLAAPLAAVAVSAHAWAPSVNVQQTLTSGKPYSEVTASTEGAGLIQAAIDIAATPKTVWGVMNDCRVLYKIIGGLTDCKILDGDPRHGWDVREQVTKGNLFVPTIHNVVRNEYQPYTVIRFHKAGGDLRIEEGEWRLEPLNGGAGTRVIYVNRVAADILAPAGLVREGMKHDTAKVLVNLRRECVAAAKSGV